MTLHWVFDVVCAALAVIAFLFALSRLDCIAELRRQLEEERYMHRAARQLANHNLVMASGTLDPEEVLPSEY